MLQSRGDDFDQAGPTLSGKREQSPFAVTKLRSVPALRVLRTNGDCSLFPNALHAGIAKYSTYPGSIKTTAAGWSATP